ncbi:MAG: magnesium-translocating P-type ATPase [Elusimicrobium sp.]|jgi:Mg2+-importing ATPase|nr:magnesium-translocating P-type ATPase [Elusimicrobium sp.]
MFNNFFNKISPAKNNDGINNYINNYMCMKTEELFSVLSSSPAGITEESVEQKLEQYGQNQIVNEQALPVWRALLDAFLNPFTIVLVVLGTLDFFLDFVFAPPGQKDLSAVIVIASMVMLSGVLRFVQEYKSAKESERLKALVKTTATVMRGGQRKEIAITQIVPGDIILLSAGDIVPADSRVISAKTLFINQSALTGESAHVEKAAPAENCAATSNALENAALCFMGTNVISGSASVMALGTGRNTFLGVIAKTVAGKKAETTFDKGMKSVNFLLIRFMVVMAPVVFLINGFGKGNWMEALLFSLSVAIGLTPEMLPMIITSNLAKGAVNMSKKSTIVKRLNSIQNFGAMDVLCTDKTGTLTEDKIILEMHLNLEGVESEDVLQHIYLNSFFQTGLKNLMDIAVINHVNENGQQKFSEGFSKVDEIPFDFQRRRMSVVISDGAQTKIITKGALEEMFEICMHVIDHGVLKELDGDIKNKARILTNSLNTQGMRVIAVAYKTCPPKQKDFNVSDECRMTLAGFAGFMDPPKTSASAAINALRENGVRVKVLTGDNEQVSRFVCKSVGLDIQKIITGADVDKYDEDDLREMVEICTVFARLSPMQKLRIVKALQDNGHTVGFLGDGINDAPSLKQADVGISVDTAVDIAKESADIILLKRDLMVLEEGVLEGRKTFGNIIKYIKMAVSSNFGNVFSVVVASIFLPFLPMLPLQILAQNLLYDLSQAAIPWDGMDKEYMKTPKKWEAGSIMKFMFWFGPCSSVFDILTYIIMFFIFQANTIASAALFQTGWFVEGLISQTLIVHMIRTEKIPFIQSRAAAPLLFMTGVVILSAMVLPFTVLGKYLGFVPLPLKYFYFLAALIAGYCILTQFVKRIYVKRYGGLL